MIRNLITEESLNTETKNWFCNRYAKKSEKTFQEIDCSYFLKAVDIYIYIYLKAPNKRLTQSVLHNT